MDYHAIAISIGPTVLIPPSVRSDALLFLSVSKVFIRYRCDGHKERGYWGCSCKCKISYAYVGK